MEQRKKLSFDLNSKEITFRVLCGFVVYNLGKDLNLSQSEWKLMRSTYTIFSVKNKTRRGQMES